MSGRYYLHSVLILCGWMIYRVTRQFVTVPLVVGGAVGSAAPLVLQRVAGQVLGIISWTRHEAKTGVRLVVKLCGLTIWTAFTAVRMLPRVGMIA